MSSLQFFDPEAEYWVTCRRLPHWSQPGTISFITWRTADSMPKEVVRQWMQERDELLKQHSISTGPDWRAKLNALPRPDRDRLKWKLTERWDRYLDECHGACVLKEPTLSKIVADSLRHFDGSRYTLTDSVIMPNHVHLLAAFPDERTMLKQCRSWKRYTARQINRELGWAGEFWQGDSFDHLVRSEDQFRYYRRYIANNPRQAHLKSGEYRWYSKSM